MITSKNWPSFGGVYKLAAIMDKDGNFVPKIKLSENSEKLLTRAIRLFTGSMKRKPVK